MMTLSGRRALLPSRYTNAPTCRGYRGIMIAYCILNIPRRTQLAAMQNYLTAVSLLLVCSATADPYLWLEDVTSTKALEWVESHNTRTIDEFAADDSFRTLEARLRSILDSKDRIPYVNKRGEYFYNFWRDADQPRGLLRRTTLDEYRKAAPQWETVLDVDALAAKQGENWVYKGIGYLEPTYDRALLRLSRGGADAVVVREFDLVSKTFVADGFELTESKGRANWLDRDSVLVTTNFGPGTMTDSGYPRVVKLWRRGLPLAKAEVVFEGEQTDVAAFVYVDQAAERTEAMIVRAIDFHTSANYVRRNNRLIELDVPGDAQVAIDRGWLSVTLKSDWPVGDTTHASGSLLLIALDDFLSGDRNFDVLFTPTPTSSLAGVSATRNYVLVNALDNVRNRIVVWRRTKDRWIQEPTIGSSGFQTISVAAVDRHESDDYMLQTTDFVTPATLQMRDLRTNAVKVTKQAPALFDANGLAISQHWVKSKDGTNVPYFQISPTASNGPRPTLLYGYGGFEIPMVPRYSATVGAAWLERGGVYVVANIRGGGEFGPQWHQAALKENRPRAYEDFIAVAQDLIRRKVSTPKQLGTMGGSNGGLLVGNMLTMRPDLFGGIVCQVPLLDMRRYNKLLAGASWMAEYGDPDDPEQWRFIETFSPYHNVSKDADYPAVLFTTSTRDDRVHPGHARKMMAKMTQMEHDVRYYENTEGGHAGAADNAQRAFMSALSYTFLWDVLD